MWDSTVDWFVLPSTLPFYIFATGKMLSVHSYIGLNFSIALPDLIGTIPQRELDGSGERHALVLHVQFCPMRMARIVELATP